MGGYAEKKYGVVFKGIKPSQSKAKSQWITFNIDNSSDSYIGMGFINRGKQLHQNK